MDYAGSGGTNTKLLSASRPVGTECPVVGKLSGDSDRPELAERRRFSGKDCTRNQTLKALRVFPHACETARTSAIDRTRHSSGLFGSFEDDGPLLRGDGEGGVRRDHPPKQQDTLRESLRTVQEYFG